MRGPNVLKISLHISHHRKYPQTIKLRFFFSLNDHYKSAENHKVKIVTLLWSKVLWTCQSGQDELPRTLILWDNTDVEHTRCVIRHFLSLNFHLKMSFEFSFIIFPVKQQ